nr:ribonuclease H protein [Tanacetum cinerariifolium]
MLKLNTDGSTQGNPGPSSFGGLIRDGKGRRICGCNEAWMERRDNDHPLKSIMDDITTMMIEQKCVMLHTRRDGNQCADHMARLGGTLSEEYIVFEEPPMTLNRIYYETLKPLISSKKIITNTSKKKKLRTYAYN